MKLRGAVLLSLFFLPTACAAATYGPPVVSDPIYGEISPFRGFYAGFGISTAWLSTTQSPYGLYSPAYPVTYTQPGYVSLGPTAQFGYNWSYGPTLIGADLNASAVNHTANSASRFYGGAYGNYVNAACPGYCGNMRANWAFDFLPRLGYTTSLGNVTPYVIGGVGYHHIAFGAPMLGDNGAGQWYPTWSVGAGVEVPVTNNISVRTQYLFNQTFVRNIEDRSLNLSGDYHF